MLTPDAATVEQAIGRWLVERVTDPLVRASGHQLFQTLLSFHAQAVAAVEQQKRVLEHLVIAANNQTKQAEQRGAQAVQAEELLHEIGMLTTKDEVWALVTSPRFYALFRARGPQGVSDGK
jgi:hypothetical protein